MNSQTSNERVMKSTSGLRLFLRSPAGWLVIAGGVFMLAAVIGLLSFNKPASNSLVEPPRVGTKMINFSLQDLDGKTVKLSDYAGHPVLVNTWATWCPPCRAEMPDLNAFYQKHESEGFVVLAINAGETRDQADAFSKQLALTFPILLDPEEKLMDRLSIHDFPTSILVGPDGLVKSVHIGMYTQLQLEEEVLPYLKQ